MCRCAGAKGDICCLQLGERADWEGVFSQPMDIKNVSAGAAELPVPGVRKAVGSRWWGWVVLALLMGYGGFLAVYFVPVASGSDSSGYLNFADLLLRGRLIDDARPIVGWRSDSPFATSPLGFLMEKETGRFVPTYPSGVPLQFAAAEWVLGRVPGMYVVGVGGALAAVILCYLVGREIGLSRTLAAVSAAMLAWNPVFLFVAIQPLSDVLATTWCLAAVWGVLRSRRGWGWAVFAGVAAAMAVLVRPTNLLVFPALLVWMPSWRALGWFVLGGLPGAAWMAWYQNALYGSPLTSGYGDVRSIFGWDNLGPTAAHYARWFPRFVPIVWILAAVALVRSLRAEGRSVLALSLWFGAIAVFYVFYDVTQEAWWCLRFLLPAMPALILGGALGIETMRRQWKGGRADRVWQWSVVAIAIWAAILGWRWSGKVNALGPSQAEAPYQEIATWIDEHAPRNAVVASLYASGAVHYYTRCAVLRWDMIERREFEEFSRTVNLDVQPVYALLFHEEAEQAFQRLPGGWEKLFENSRGAIWRFLGPAS